MFVSTGSSLVGLVSDQSQITVKRPPERGGTLGGWWEGVGSPRLEDSLFVLCSQPFPSLPVDR